MNTHTDRIVRATWWVLVMGFIAGAGIGAIFVAYQGVGELLVGRAAAGSVGIVTGIALAGATWLACKHRTDLLCG